MSETAVKDEAPASPHADEVPAAEEKPVDAPKSAKKEDDVVDAAEGESKEGEQDKGVKKAKDPENMLKTRGTVDHKNYSNNMKFDPKSLPETDDPKQIRTQVISHLMCLSSP